MRLYRLAFLLALSVPGVFGENHADNAASPSIGQDPFKELEQVSKERSHEKALQVAAKEQYFVDSFNRLAAALEDFSKTYKQTHTIDAKQAKSIRDAYRKLEQADPWFRAK